MSNQNTPRDIIYSSGDAPQLTSAASNHNASAHDSLSHVSSVRLPRARVSKAEETDKSVQRKQGGMHNVADDDEVLASTMNNIGSPLLRTKIDGSTLLVSSMDVSSEKADRTIDYPSSMHEVAQEDQRAAWPYDHAPQSKKRKRETNHEVQIDRADNDMLSNLANATNTAVVQAHTSPQFEDHQTPHDSGSDLDEEEHAALRVRLDVQRCEGYIMILQTLLDMCKAKRRTGTVVLMAKELEKVIDKVNSA